MARLRIKDEKLLKKLTPPRNPEGGWLPPNPQALADFEWEIQQEAIRRFGVDEDNDTCVLVRLMDNSRKETINYEPIPRDIKESPYHPYGKKWNKSTRDPLTKKLIEPKHTIAEEEARTKALLKNRLSIQRTIAMNFNMANHRMEQFMREQEFLLQDQIDAPDKKRAARIKQLEAIKEKWTDVFAYYESLGYYEIDRETRTYWYHPDARSGEDKRLFPIAPRYKMGDKPGNYDELMDELQTLKKYKPAKEIEF